MPSSITQSTAPGHPSVVPASSQALRERALELRAEAAAEQDGARTAALLYQAGCLTETALRKPAQAVQDYLAAYNADSRSTIALLALLRMFERRGSRKNLSRLYDAQLRTAQTPQDRGRALLDQASCDLIYGGNEEALRARLKRAAEADDTGEVALLLEWQSRADGDVEAAQDARALRIGQCDDPAQRSVLLAEEARQLERAGDVDGALLGLQRAALEAPQSELCLVELARFAADHKLESERVDALERRAELLEAALDAEGASPLTAEDVEAHKQRAVALWCEAARLRCVALDDPSSALPRLERAFSLSPNHLLPRLTRMQAYDMLGEREQAAADAEVLLARADGGEQAAVLLFRVAQQALANGNREEAHARLTQAVEAAGGSLVADALLEDLQRDLGLHEEQIRRGEQKAEHAPENEAAGWLRDAASAACEMGDGDRALELFRRAEAALEGEAETARAAYTASLKLAHPALARFACERMLSLPLDEDERAAVLHKLLEVSDQEAARTLLDAELSAEPSREFLVRIARLRAAEQARPEELARAHLQLAETTTSEDAAISHLVAAARAQLRAGDLGGAQQQLERALAHSSSHRYAIALLEKVLDKQAKPEALLPILKRAAEAEQAGRQAELSALKEALSAEQAGDSVTAQRLYEQAGHENPASPSAHWAALLLSRTEQNEAGAEKALSRLAALAGRAASHLDTLGWVEQRLAKGAPAMRSITQPLVELFHDDHVGSHAAALLLTQAGVDGEQRGGALERLMASAGGENRDWLARLADWEALRKGEGLGAPSRAAPPTEGPPPADAFSLMLKCLPSSKPGPYLQQLSAWAEASADQVVRSTAAAESCWLQSASASEVDAFSQIDSELPLDAGVARELLSVDAAIPPSQRISALSAWLAEDDEGEDRCELALELARAHIAVGDGARAVRCLEAVFRQDPDHLCALELSRVAARMAGDHRTAALAAQRLAEAVEGPSAQQLLEESASLWMDELDDDAAAEPLLRRALETAPASTSAYARLHDLLRRREDTAALVELVGSRTECVDDPEELVALFYEIARLRRARGELDAALDALTNVLMLDEHVGALALSVEIHTSRGDWEQAVQALDTLACAKAVPQAQRRLARLGAADFLANRLSSPARAIEQLDKLVALAPSDPELPRRIADLAERSGDYERAANALRAAAALSPPESAIELRLRAGGLLAERLERPTDAAALYRAVLTEAPENKPAAFALYELTQDPAVLDSFFAEATGRAQRAPTEPEPLRDLLAVAHKRADGEVQYLTLAALSALGLSTREELAETELLLRRAVEHKVEGDVALTDQDLQQLLPRGLQLPYVQLMRNVFAHAAALDQLEPSRFGLGRKNRLSARNPLPLQGELSRLGAAFGLSLKDVYVGGDDPSRVVAIADGSDVSWVVGSAIGAPLSSLRRDEVAAQLAGCRLHALPLLSRSAEQATRLLLAAFVAGDCSLPPRYAGERLGELPRTVARALPRRARKAIAELVRALPDGGAALAGQCVLATRHTRRVGLLVAGNLQSALDRTVGAMPSLATIDASDDARDLLACWASTEMATLRKKLGLAL